MARCPVCSFETTEAVCARCSTILLRGQAICPKCGKIFTGPIAACDSCGAAVSRAPETPATEDSVHALAQVPGIGEARARELVGHGFRDFADLVRLALPESAVRKGLHHAIARKVLLSALPSQGDATVAGVPCPTCGTDWRSGQERCPACGSEMGGSLDVRVLESKLREVTGEIVDLAADPDFQEMPEPMREELLRAFGGIDEAELLGDEYRRQIEAWRVKGFDVKPLEDLLEEDVQGFQERSVRLIRSQMMKKGERGHYRCPLCEVRLSSTAEVCDNCGARFA